MSTKWDYGIVSFLDILGFADLVEKDAKSFEPKHLDRLLESIKDAKASTPAGSLKVQTFSDSVVISASFSQSGFLDSLVAVSKLQNNFISHGVLVRGGVAYGKHFSDEEAIYSEALVRSYYLERNHARFPRVLVDKDLWDWFFNDERTTADQQIFAREKVLRDRDNHVFVNYLNAESLKPHFDFLTGYDKSGITAGVLEKIQWLAEYHNHISEQLDKKHLITGALTDGFRPI